MAMCGSPSLGYDAGMPVRQDLAYDLLKSVSKLEFQLRRHGDFFRSDRHGHPILDVAWRKVEERVRPLDDAFLEEVPEWARKRLLGQRDERPMKQKIVEENGRLVARFRPCPLDADSEAVALVQAMQQVRNNLFHGGEGRFGRGSIRGRRRLGVCRDSGCPRPSTRPGERIARWTPLKQIHRAEPALLPQTDPARGPALFDPQPDFKRQAFATTQRQSFHRPCRPAAGLHCCYIWKPAWEL